MDNHTFSPSLSYTVLGDKSSFIDDSKVFSFVLLVREDSPFFREELFKFLSDFSFIKEVLVIDRPSASIDLEPYLQRYPKIRFILVDKEHTWGEKINIAMEEATSNSVFILWSDTEIQNPFWLSSLFQGMRQKKCLCVVPELLDKEGLILPTVHIPVFNEKTLKIIDLPAEEEIHFSLYPHDYIGLYNRSLFLSLGGFDSQISSYYWQKVDFGMRAYQWGEKIGINRTMKLRYSGDFFVESLSGEESYSFFYLKNYWPYYVKDHIEFSFWRWLTLLKPSKMRVKDILKNTLDIKQWLYKHRYRYKKDLKGVIELWEDSTFL